MSEDLLYLRERKALHVFPGERKGVRIALDGIDTAARRGHRKFCGHTARAAPDVITDTVLLYAEKRNRGRANLPLGERCLLPEKTVVRDAGRKRPRLAAVRQGEVQAEQGVRRQGRKFRSERGLTERRRAAGKHGFIRQRQIHTEVKFRFPGSRPAERCRECSELRELCTAFQDDKHPPRPQENRKHGILFSV